MLTLEHSNYHSVLRIFAATFTLTLLFVSGAVVPHTQLLTLETEQYLATVVGASAAVEPTELNTITAGLTAQQRNLDERDARLAERELALGLRASDSTSWWRAEYTTLINSVLLFIVLVLMLLNYTLDFAYRRGRETAAVHNSVSA